MPLALAKGTLTPIAVDFGVSALKALQLSGDGERATVVAATALDTPAELLNKDNERLRWQLDALGPMLKGAGFKGRRAVCAIGATRTFAEVMRVPVQPGMDIDQALRTHLLAVCGIDTSGLIVRRRELGETVRGGQRYVHVQCLAMPRDVVMLHMEGLKRCRLETVGVHPEHVAVVRAFDHVTRRDADDDLHSLYLDLGYGTSKVVFAKGREVTIAKTITIAGRDADAAAAKRDKSSMNHARERRVASYTAAQASPEQAGVSPAFWGTSDAQMVTPVHGAASARAANGSTNAGTSAAAGVATLDAGAGSEGDRRVGATAPGMIELAENRGPEGDEPIADADQDRGEHGNDRAASPNAWMHRALGDELLLCMEYHRQTHPDAELGRVVVMGGEARDVALVQELAGRLRCGVQLADPIAAAQRGGRTAGVDFSQPQPGWAVALGLSVAPTDL